MMLRVRTALRPRKVSRKHCGLVAFFENLNDDLQARGGSMASGCKCQLEEWLRWMWCVMGLEGGAKGDQA